MGKRFFLIGLALTLVVASCQRSDMQSLEVPVYELSVAASDFTSLDQVASRATEKAFDAGDVIGLYVSQGSAVVGASGNHSSNVPYRYDEPAWRALRALGGELEAAYSYKTTAYYPYVHGLSDPTKVAHEVLADQSVVGSMERSDFMVSAPSVITGLSATPQNPKSTLLFTHSLAKFIVTMSVPEELEEAQVIALTEVKFRGLRMDCVVNVVTGMVFNSATAVVGDVTPRLTSASGTGKGAVVRYEAILPPQVIGAGSGVVWMRFATDQGDREMTYVIPANAGITLTANQKYILNLSSISDLAFVTEVDRNVLLDGLAHSEVELKVKSKESWTLTSSNAWLRVKVAGGAYGNSVSGAGAKGEQTVYLDFAANTNATSSRATVLSLESSSGSKIGYTINQNYFNYNSTPKAWSPSAGVWAQALAPIDGNQVIRITSDEGVASGASSWLKIASSAVLGQGDPKVSVDVVGSLGASDLYFQAGVNNTSNDRSTTVRYTPVDLNGNLVPSQVKTHTITQKAPAFSDFANTLPTQATGSAAPVSWTGRVVTPVKGLSWQLFAAANANVTIAPANLLTAQTAERKDISISVSVNNTGAVRHSKYQLKYGSLAAKPLSTELTISQNAPTVTYAPAKWDPAGSAATQAVNVTTELGVLWKPTVASTANWLSISGGVKSNATGTGAAQGVTLAATVNPNNAVRKGTLTVSYGSVNGWASFALKKDFTVTQAASTMGALTQSPANNIAAEGATVTVKTPKATAGLPWTAKLSNTTGFALGAVAGSGVTGSVPVTVSVNPTKAVRSSTLTATATGGNTAGTITISQAASTLTYSSPSATTPVTLEATSVNFTVTGTKGLTLSFARTGGDAAFSTPAGLTCNGSAQTVAVTMAANMGNAREAVYSATVTNPGASGFALTGITVKQDGRQVNPPATTDYETVGGIKWAKGNLVADGANGCKVGAPGDNGLYFQFGSLVGWSGGANGDGTGAGNPTPELEIRVNPTDYSGSTDWRHAGSYTAAGTAGTGYGLPTTDVGAGGVGDPCRYYLGAPWRTPTAAEWSALVGGSGENTNKRIPLAVNNTALSFPASGSRTDSNGSPSIVGSDGHYWSSSIKDATYGYNLYFTSSGKVYPQKYDNRLRGIPVRCVSPL